MADFAIGQGFIKAHRSILLMTPLRAPCRYFPTRDSSGFITRPTFDAGDWARELQTVKQVSFSVDNNEKDFRLIGDEGWSDSVTTGSRVSASFDTFFSKSIVQAATAGCPEFRGDYSEEFALVEKSRYDTDSEVFVEMFKELGRANGSMYVCSACMRAWVCHMWGFVHLSSLPISTIDSLRKDPNA
jgi:hypothetical protein